jgi:hypothetical protein
MEYLERITIGMEIFYIETMIYIGIFLGILMIPILIQLMYA